MQIPEGFTEFLEARPNLYKLARKLGYKPFIL
jgi:hypothetical protein